MTDEKERWVNQKKYADRRRELGWVKVACWVPKTERTTLLTVAQQLRDGAFTHAQR